MRFLLIDEHSGHENGMDEGVKVFPSMEAVQDHLDGLATDYADDRYSFDTWQEGLTLYEVGEKISVSVEQRVIVKIGDRASHPAMSLPSPQEGETIAQYMERVSAMG